MPVLTFTRPHALECQQDLGFNKVTMRENVQAAGGEILEEIEESKAFWEVYDGAVYMFQVACCLHWPIYAASFGTLSDGSVSTPSAAHGERAQAESNCAIPTPPHLLALPLQRRRFGLADHALVLPLFRAGRTCASGWTWTIGWRWSGRPTSSTTRAHEISLMSSLSAAIVLPTLPR